MTDFATPPERLCLLRLSALGDATHVVPLVRTLQRAWPATRLAWIVGKGERMLLEGLECVKQIVETEPDFPLAYIGIAGP